MKDLSNELTVFLISVGNNPNYSHCLEALQKQTVKFKLDIIKDYYPMSNAFQQMLVRCSTPYYIEVDEDMILMSHSIERMYEGIIHSDNKTVMIAYKLHDTHLDFEICGIKIYKFNIFKNYPYNLNHPSCEMEQLERLKKDGHIYKTVREVVGEHSPNWSNELIFERYYNLMEKFKLYKYNWLERLPEKLFTLFKQHSTEQNLFALMGAFSSIFSNETINEEKDMRKKREDYFKIKSYLHPPHTATIYMTSRCNFKCEWCARQYKGIESAKDFNANLVNVLLQKFPSLKGVCICGFGSPLLSPNLFEVLRTLKKANKVIGLITNGSLLKEKIDELSDPNVSPNYISVSLNAHNKEFHQKTTKTDTWDLVIEGIKASINSPIPTYVTYVVTTENMQYVPQFLKVVNSLKVKTVYLHNVLPHFEEKENINFWDLVLTKEHKSIIEEWKKLPEADIVKKFPVLIEKDNCPNLCMFPYTMIGVDGDGNLSICNSVYPCSPKMGNLFNDVIWQSDEFQDFRNKALNKEIDACKKCFRNFEYL